MNIRRAVLLGICLLASGFQLDSSTDGWKTFKSTKYRYTVQYPASWYLFTTTLRPKLDSLDILNFPPEQRLTGVVLREFGAGIQVGRASSEIQTMEQWIELDTKHNTEVKQRSIQRFTEHPSGCMELVEVTSLSEVGPEAYFSEIAYYCSAKHGLFRVLLLNWKDDPNQDQLRTTALNIALSLRSW